MFLRLDTGGLKPNFTDRPKFATLSFRHNFTWATSILYNFMKHSTTKHLNTPFLMAQAKWKYYFLSIKPRCEESKTYFGIMKTRTFVHHEKARAANSQLTAYSVSVYCWFSVFKNVACRIAEGANNLHVWVSVLMVVSNQHRESS